MLKRTTVYLEDTEVETLKRISFIQSVSMAELEPRGSSVPPMASDREANHERSERASSAETAPSKSTHTASNVSCRRKPRNTWAWHLARSLLAGNISNNVATRRE